MKRFSVTFECRTPGAIGAFWNRSYSVDAADADAARATAFDLAHADGLETRFPLSVVEIPTQTLYEECAALSLTP